MLVALLACAMTLGLAGCGAERPTADPDVLLVGGAAEPATLDLTVSPQASISQLLLYNVYEGLVKVGADGSVSPLLAESWQVSADRLSYTFALREATWHDGSELTADHVAASLERVIAPQSAHPFKGQLAAITGVAAPDARTVVVTLSRPSNDLLYRLGSPVGLVLHPDHYGALATEPIGTGPYRFASWRRGDRAELERFDGYWGRPARIPTVIWRFFIDPTAINNAMLSDDLDVIAQVLAPQSLGQFEDPERFVIIQGATNGEVVLAMNPRRPALADPRVRRAIRLAINRQQVRDLAWSGYGSLVGSMVPPLDPWYEDLTGLRGYDPARARRLLTQAGAEDLTLQLRPANLPYAVAAAQVVADQLGRVGIRVEIDPQEFPAAWLARVFTQHDFDLSIVAHVEPRDIAAFANPDYYFGFDDERFRRLLDDADTGPMDQQLPAMRAAARRLAEQDAADWLWLLPNLVVTRTGISGVEADQATASFELAGIGKEVAP